MSGNREFDLVIFGASGFTGKYVVEEMLKVNKTENLKWAIAGRSRNKLQGVLSDLKQEIPYENEFGIEIILADIEDYQSILMMCQRSSLILDCIGPYRLFGEPVIQACVESSTNFIDICGEPQFLENMQLKYNEGAEKANVHIVGACGFDSIPSEMGVVFARQQFDGILNSVTCYLNIKSGPSGFKGHYGTYASAVHGIGDAKTLGQVRKAFNFKPLPNVGQKLKFKGSLHYDSSLESYAIPFLGADPSVVKRTQRFLYENLETPPIQFSMYSCISGLWNVFLLAFFGGIFKFLANRTWGKHMLLNNPKFFSAGMFSHEGPSPLQLKETSFSLTMFGEGYSNAKNNELNRVDKPDKKITIKVVGPEPGYVATPIMMVQAAVVMLKEPGKLPDTGGVYPPGAAFHNTSLIQRLQERGMEFNVSN